MQSHMTERRDPRPKDGIRPEEVRQLCPQQGCLDGNQNVDIHGASHTGVPQAVLHNKNHDCYVEPNQQDVQHVGHHCLAEVQMTVSEAQPRTQGLPTQTQPRRDTCKR